MPNPVPQFTPPIVESKHDPEFAQHLHTIHQLVFDKLQNHYTAIGNLQTQISALQAQIKKLGG